MGDWDFLHDMHTEGYSADQIADAAACGYNPYEDFGFSPDEWEAIDHNYQNAEHIEANPELEAIFDSLVTSAESFYKLTNRYLQIWGELGELFAEIEYGIKRHKPKALTAGLAMTLSR